MKSQLETEYLQLESMTEQRRGLLDILIVSVLAISIVWLAASVYLWLTGKDILGALQYPAGATTIASCITVAYCMVAFALNRKKKLPFVHGNAAVLLILLTLSIALSDSPYQ